MRLGELGKQAFGLRVEAVELALDAQLDQDVLVRRPEDVEPLRRMAVLRAAGLDVTRLVDEKALDVTQIAGDEEFLPVYQIRLLAGRNLVHADSLKEFVINEKLSRLMGCKKPEEALGKVLYWGDRPYPVVGVVADFHSRSFREPHQRVLRV